jgi:hypothetical protein
MKYQIIKEDLSRFYVPSRFYVIAAPINETGICFEFESREAAQAWIDKQAESGL